MKIILEERPVKAEVTASEPGTMANRLVMHQSKERLRHYPSNEFDFTLIDKDTNEPIYQLDQPYSSDKEIGFVIALIEGRLYAVRVNSAVKERAFGFDFAEHCDEDEDVHENKPYDQSPYWSKETILSAGAYVIAMHMTSDNEKAEKLFKELISQCVFSPSLTADKACFDLVAATPVTYTIETMIQMLDTKTVPDNHKLIKEQSIEGIVYRFIKPLIEVDGDEALIVFKAVDSYVPIAIVNADTEQVVNFILADATNISPSLNGQLLLGDDIAHRALFHGIVVRLFDKLHAIKKDPTAIVVNRHGHGVGQFLAVASYCPFDFVPYLAFGKTSSNEVRERVMRLELKSIGMTYDPPGHIGDEHRLHPYEQLRYQDHDDRRGRYIGESLTSFRYYGRVKDIYRSKPPGAELADSVPEPSSGKTRWLCNALYQNPCVQFWESVYRIIATTDILFDREKVLERRQKYIQALEQGAIPITDDDVKYTKQSHHYA